MEKSLEQLKHIERISKQTRHHRTYLNQVCDQNLRTKLKQLANEREQSILRSTTRRQLEEERKQLCNITIKQIARERQYEPLPIKSIQKIEEETVQVLSNDDESRPSSSIKLPSTEKSCRLFSHNCQLYPCQPIYEYKSIIKKENDQIVRKRDSSNDNSLKTSNKHHLQELFTTIEEKKYQQTHRQLVSAIHNQHHQVNRHVSMQRTMNRLDEQSQLLHERLVEKKIFGYANVKERQHRLSQAIQRHLKITAKFCA